MSEAKLRELIQTYLAASDALEPLQQNLSDYSHSSRARSSNPRFMKLISDSSLAIDAKDRAREALDTALAAPVEEVVLVTKRCSCCEGERTAPWLPYCGYHSRLYDAEWGICRAKSCSKWAVSEYPFTCARHNGKDYVPHTHEPPL